MDEVKMDAQQRQDAAAIRLNLDKRRELYNENNMYEAAKLFTQDMIMLQPLLPLLKGRTGMQNSWRISRNDLGIMRCDYGIHEFLVLKPDMAITQEWGIFYNDKDEVLTKTIGIMVWKKKEGKWYCHIQSTILTDRDITKWDDTAVNTK